MHEKLPGLRICVNPWMKFFCFPASSVKSIPQIKEMKELVARKYGEPLEFDPEFPGWERLAEVSEELRGLKMGYRAKYAAGRTPNCELTLLAQGYCRETMATGEIKALELPGVGPKVADCCCSSSFENAPFQ